MFYERNKVLTMLEQKKIPLGIQCFTGNTALIEVLGATASTLSCSTLSIATTMPGQRYSQEELRGILETAISKLFPDTASSFTFVTSKGFRPKRRRRPFICPWPL